MSKTHWKQLVNMDYLGAYALPDGNDLTLTISKVVKEVVTGNSGRKEQCMVMYFKEPDYKPMILNRTNAKSIQALVKTQEYPQGSPMIEDWIGHKVTLYGSTTRFGGDVVECLRIRPTVADTSRTYYCEKCGSEVKGTATITVEQLVAGSKKKFGKVLCMDCAMAEGKKNEAVQTD